MPGSPAALFLNNSIGREHFNRAGLRAVAFSFSAVRQYGVRILLLKNKFFPRWVMVFLST